MEGGKKLFQGKKSQRQDSKLKPGAWDNVLSVQSFG